MNSLANHERQLRSEEIRRAIAQITAILKGPLPNFERLTLHEERKELRAKLAKQLRKEHYEN